MSPVILIGVGVLVFGLGAGLGYWFSQISGRREASKAADIQQELDEYRRQVTEHFGETAQHFKAIGQQYQSLYKHMAHGAEALCDPAQSDALLEFPAGQTAALATSDDEPASAPETIRDYAPGDEEQDVSKKSKGKDADAAEKTAKADPAEAGVEAPKPQEEVADAISKAETGEAERTVH